VQLPSIKIVGAEPKKNCFLSYNCMSVIFTKRNVSRILHHKCNSIDKEIVWTSTFLLLVQPLFEVLKLYCYEDILFSCHLSIMFLCLHWKSGKKIYVYILVLCLAVLCQNVSIYVYIIVLCLAVHVRMSVLTEFY
jgi:hypothetical protein